MMAYNTFENWYSYHIFSRGWERPQAGRTDAQIYGDDSVSLVTFKKKTPRKNDAQVFNVKSINIMVYHIFRMLN